MRCRSRIFTQPGRFSTTSVALLKHLDRNGLQFARVSSSVCIAWQRVVGRRLKSDIRVANTPTWTTFACWARGFGKARVSIW
ncbi:type IIL restriction-modification enzyme MmeI [Corynebacterium sp. NML120713]|uniref:type IIL restriction-modification enzyme MmeI n=1 Tax=Corynebacterium TaxID=1716 RepID=UPI003518D668